MADPSPPYKVTEHEGNSSNNFRPTFSVVVGTVTYSDANKLPATAVTRMSTWLTKIRAAHPSDSGLGKPASGSKTDVWTAYVNTYLYYEQTYKSAQSSYEAAHYWASPGQWRSYLSNPIPDPPPQTYKTYVAVAKPRIADNGYTFKTFDKSLDATVSAWLNQYYDDGSFQRDYSGTHATHGNIAYMMSYTLAQQPHSATDKYAIPDQGRAQPIDSAAQLFQPIADILGKVFSWQFVLRLMEFAIGAIALGVGLATLSKSASTQIQKVPVYGNVIGRVTR